MVNANLSEPCGPNNRSSTGFLYNEAPMSISNLGVVGASVLAPGNLLLNPDLQIRTSKIHNIVDACLLPHRLIKTEGQKPEAIATDHLPAKQFVKTPMSSMLSS